MKIYSSDMTAIKLFKVDEMENGDIRLQSQLYVGKGTVDFILRTDDVLENYGYGERGFGFYKTDIPYEIFLDKKDMKYQKL